MARLKIAVLLAFPFAFFFRLYSIQKSQNTIHHEVSVTMKLVQVYVTDRKGKPVSDLKNDDFELRDNGALMAITGFEEHGLLAGKKSEITPPPDNYIPSAISNRKFFFFFDFAFNSLPGIIKSKKAALSFIKSQVLADDEIGVFSYDVHEGLRLHEYLTTDHNRISKVIQDLGNHRFLGRVADIQNEYSNGGSDQRGLTEGPSGDNQFLGIESVEKIVYESQTSLYISSLRDLAKALRYLPGMKNVILFSSGIANYVLFGSKYYLPVSGSRYGNSGLRTLYESVCKEMAASNVSIYALNVAGIGHTRFRDRDTLGDWTLYQMARETGGKYYDDILTYKQSNEDIQSITGSYYILGYVINEKVDGEYHKINVRAKRKGYEVHGQIGYFNPKPFMEYSENEKFLQLIDLALSEKPHLQEAVDFPIMVLPYAAGKKTDLSVLASIPVDKLAEVRGGVFEIYTIVFNDKNDIVILRRKELSRWPTSSTEAFAKSLISLAAGNYECRVVLRNMTTGKGARGSSQIVVPEESEAGTLPHIYPLLLKPLKNTIFLGEEEAQKETPLTDIYPFDSTEYAPIIGKLGPADTKIRVIIPLPVKEGREGNLTFSALLIIPASGEKGELPISVLSHNKTRSGSEAYSLEIAIEGLKPGEYTLMILIDRLAPGVLLTVPASFSVK